MKRCFFSLLMLVTVATHAQTRSVASLRAAVDALDSALVAADSVAIMRLTSDSLTYGHSTGKVENRNEFINSVLHGPLRFQSIDISAPYMLIQKDVAIVRHDFSGKAVTNGTTTELHLGVLQVWRLEGRSWKLLARQAVKK